MKTTTYYAITKNSDSTEGRGIEIPIAYTENEALALDIVNDKRFARYCVMGVHNKEYVKNAIRKQDTIIVDSVEEFYNLSKTEARLKALNKLTIEERSLLGLK